MTRVSGTIVDVRKRHNPDGTVGVYLRLDSGQELEFSLTGPGFDRALPGIAIGAAFDMTYDGDPDYERCRLLGRGEGWGPVRDGGEHDDKP